MTLCDYVIVDVFTEVPLEGNPVAVFTDASGLSDEVMQRAARELNLSETVFVLASDADADARVRIFTPQIELPFAGHPVLGTAFVLGERSPHETIRLETGAGVVPIALTREQRVPVFGEMDQPLPKIEAPEREDELLSALGIERAGLPIEGYRNGPLHVFVALESEQAVACVAPDMNALERLGALGVSCFALTAPATVKTRVFAPGLGVPEDPATGSAAGPLALHLARHRKTAFGERIEIRQGAEIGRPSVLYATAEGTHDQTTRIGVGGAAVVVARGSYRLT